MQQPHQTHRNKLGYVLLLVAMGGLLTPIHAQTPPNNVPAVTDTNKPPRRHHRPPPPGHDEKDAASHSANAVGTASPANEGCARGLSSNHAGGPNGNGGGHRPPHPSGKPVPDSAATNPSAK